MSRARAAILLAAGAGCVAAPATMLTGVHSPARVAAAFILFCLGPGAAMLRLLAPRAGRVELALVVAMSLTVSALAAQTMLWLGAWKPAAGACALAAVCLMSIAWQLVEPIRAHAGEGGDLRWPSRPR